MKQSEFWQALEQVFGSALGLSLVHDLYLPSLQDTAARSLADGVKPEVVWAALVEETGTGEEARWIHRRPGRKPRG